MYYFAVFIQIKLMYIPKYMTLSTNDIACPCRYIRGISSIDLTFPQKDLTDGLYTIKGKSISSPKFCACAD